MPGSGTVVMVNWSMVLFVLKFPAKPPPLRNEKSLTSMLSVPPNWMRP